MGGRGGGGGGSGTPPQSPTPHKGRYGEPNSKLERQPLLGGSGDAEQGGVPERDFRRAESQSRRASRLSKGSAARPSWGSFAFNTSGRGGKEGGNAGANRARSDPDPADPDKQFTIV
jgi:hypothetical protein